MPKAQLLLVEDDSALAELVRWHFEREEFDVQHTGDGEEALLMAKERTPDLVLLDWMLENLSGIEVCRQLRKADNTANVPIIMLTARGEEDDLPGFGARDPRGQARGRGLRDVVLGLLPLEDPAARRAPARVRVRDDPAPVGV